MGFLDQQYYLDIREWRMNHLQNQLAAQTRIKDLRDDPIAAGHATRYQSETARMQRFTTNIESVRGTYALAEGNMRSALDIMHRVRELSVQGANGIYEKDQLASMGEEVNQLLNELVKIANSPSGEGTMLFAGYQSRIEPFRISTGRVAEARGEVITAVDYIGNIGRNEVQVSGTSTAAAGIPGNHVFWAEDQQIFSSVGAMGYRVQADSTLRIDGVEIPLKEGDNVYAIVSRINDSQAPVRAGIDPVQGSLTLTTTHPHQIWAEDARGRVLQDLGILAPGNAAPPLNLADTALAAGGSAFDMVIHLRDRFYAGDSAAIGGSGLRGIDQAIEVLTTNLAEMGARDNRLQFTADRLAWEIPELLQRGSEEADLDFSEAIIDLRMLDYTHRAALGTAARVLQPTLLDFLR
jgi:flagellar hook-associated protein 3 FlgL